MNQSTTKKRKLTSSVWDYIEEVIVKDKRLRQCSLPHCHQTFSVNSSTSTLKKHLRVHGLFLPDDTQQRLSSHVNDNVLSLTMQSPNPLESIQTRFETQLCDWIVTSQSPFSSVENPEFVKLFSLATVSYTHLTLPTIYSV